MPKILDKKYIIDLEDLNEIKSFLDDSIDRFTGQVSSLREFAQKANADSEYRRERPIEIEVVAIEGEDRGLRIWFADAPNVTTSTTYLSKYLDIENEFGISSLRQRLGIEQSESAEAAQEMQSSKSKPERNVPNDRSLDSSQSEESKLTQPSGADDDEDLDETPIILDVKALKSPPIQFITPPRSTLEKNSKDKPKNKSKQVNYSSDDIIGNLSSEDDSGSLDEGLASSEAAVETNEGIGEDIVGNLEEDVSLISELPSEKLIALDDEDTSPAEQACSLESLIEPIQEPDASTLTSHNPYQPIPLEEASNVAHRATTSGEHLSGVNLLGGVGQALAVGVALEQKVVNEIKLRGIERKESRTWDRAVLLGGRIQGIRAAKQKQEDQLDSFVDAAAATVERSEDLAERVTIVSDTTQREQPQLMEEASEDLPSHSEDEAESQPRSKKPVPNAGVSPPPESPESPEEFLTNMASLGDRVRSMATELGLEQDKLQPLRFYSDESFNARLTRVERYLEQINQRLDLIEQAVEKLEVELGIRQANPAALTNEPRISATEALLASREEATLVDRTDWDRFCGECLLNYAESVNQTNGKSPRDSNEFRLAENRSLSLALSEENNNTTRVAVEDENGNPVYLSVVESTKDGNRWMTKCNELKSDADRNLIASLPQRSQDYQKQQTAQALVTQLVSRYPGAFSERQESSAKTIMIAAGHSTAYRFKVAEVDGQLALLGVEASSDRLALRASFNQRGWRVEQCDIPTEHLNAMMQSDSRKDIKNHSKEKPQSKTSGEPHYSRKQGRSESELD